LLHEVIGQEFILAGNVEELKRENGDSEGGLVWQGRVFSAKGAEFMRALKVATTIFSDSAGMARFGESKSA
jgi:hypothetical protein